MYVSITGSFCVLQGVRFFYTEFSGVNNVRFSLALNNFRSCRVLVKLLYSNEYSTTKSLVSSNTTREWT